ncbi:ribosomal protein S18 acetylase RimI-like enzyme [Stackebrandtia albiflava]|uniref:Ribosomal protein S18 acetylase RimI-like enzyme n=1 Tax=Stackebrandtia albiflava TaxID=406432 RepID=A0A562UQ09_9ACTN|nr:GNAT family N-acetyltransferase [Stackebrandtia albiflava]TWJ07687.1 ribosomal protein S18 acetylase RimI-like enzyme [Stackebrandtia albiflava]
MTQVRAASPDDAGEIVRLRALMHHSMGSDGIAEQEWRDAAARMLRRELAEPEPRIMVFVVDAGDAALAACATGTIQQRLPAPGNPSGLVGYVSNVCTDVPYRRRGHARACMLALMDWFAGRGVDRLDLRASAEAEPMYTALGFTRTTDPSMRMRLTTGTARR